MLAASEFEAFRLPWDQVIHGAALFVRASAFVFAAPLLGTEGAPPQVRAGLALLLVLVLAPVVPAPNLSSGLLALMFSEALVGFLIGYSATLVIDLATVAGDLAGHPTSLLMAQQLDPMTHAQTAALAIFYRLLATMIFLAIGGHHQVIQLLAQSYQIVPVGGVHLGTAWCSEAIGLTGQVLALGLRLAAPVLVAGILCDVFLMLVARAAPQMNIIAIGAPIRLVVGLLAVAASLTTMTTLLQTSLDGTIQSLLAIFRAWAG